MSKDDTEYKSLLERARSQLPQTVFDDTRFEIPRFHSNIEGRRTVISNFTEVAQILRREPRHLLKYLSGEMGTAGTLDGQRAVFNGKHGRSFLNELLKRYVEEYILCHECGKPDTHFITRDRILMVKCEACGATRAPRAIK